ncbi:MAG: hypothetical protein WA821_01730 [Anaerolineales bacterium]
MKTGMQQPWLWFFWTLATALSWVLVVYPGLRLRHLFLSSWQMLPETAWTLFLSTIVLGLFVGIFQYLILRYSVPVSLEWALISAFSYAVGSALAFLLSSLWLGALWPDALSGSETTRVLMPVDLTMLIGGALTGLIQACAVKYKYNFIFQIQPKRKILLWTLANAVSWGAGSIASIWAYSLPVYQQSGVAGLMVGAMTGLVFLVLLEQKPAS